VLLAPAFLIYVWVRLRWTRVWAGAIAGLALLSIALPLPRDARYLMWLSPVLCLLIGAALDDFFVLAGARAASWRSRAAIALVFVALLGGPLYAAYRWLVVGPPPASAAAVDAWLDRRLPMYRALLFVNEHRGPGSFYALYGERLHYFGGARQLGEYNGPYRYDAIAPLLDRPRSLARRLRGFGADTVLLSIATVGPAAIEGLAASPDFRLVYRDEEAVVLAIVGPRPRVSG
jgi:hypothetical protein